MLFLSIIWKLKSSLNYSVVRPVVRTDIFWSLISLVKTFLFLSLISCWCYLLLFLSSDRAVYEYGYSMYITWFLKSKNQNYETNEKKDHYRFHYSVVVLLQITRTYVLISWYIIVRGWWSIDFDIDVCAWRTDV
jgi:hypothetical protein